MDQQMVTAIAVALATKASEGLAEGGRAAFESLARLVRRAFQSRAAASAALTDAEVDPADGARITALQRALSHVMSEDPAFDTDLQDLWREISPHLTVSDGGIVNNISGRVEGNAVQARDIHGGISFGTSRRGES